MRASVSSPRCRPGTTTRPPETVAPGAARVLVTGGAGFIGGALVRRLVRDGATQVANLDRLSYVSSLESLQECRDDPRHLFHQVDLLDRDAVSSVIAQFAPEAVVHLAAQTHVDNSIERPDAFVEANVNGTFNLLETCRDWWRTLPPAAQKSFRFLHVSTDEVYGDLEPDAPPFVETSVYRPSSPYSATKAAADHLARAWHRTYGFPTIVTNCSNNYGPWQYPEKLIPVLVTRALNAEPLPIYGDGQQRRDWLHVDDHVDALLTVLRHGEPGATYNIGGRAECTNLFITETICAALDSLKPRPALGPDGYYSLLSYVEDRPGHDRRYAIDCAKIEAELGWRAASDFGDGLRSTVEWYCRNQDWCRQMLARKPDNLHWLKA